jgi:hypothetical protein
MSDELSNDETTGDPLTGDQPASEAPALYQDAKPWEQQEGESHRHYEWFHEFLMMGPSRSILGAFKQHQARKSNKKYTQPSGAWRDASINWKWRDRAQAWDVEQRRLEGEAHQRRRQAVQAKRFQIAEKIFDKVELMASFPVHETKHIGGTTIIEPAKWTWDTLAKLVQAGDKLLSDEEETTVRINQRRSKGAVSNTAVNSTSDDDDELTDEEIEQRITLILERRGPRGNPPPAADQGTSGETQ